MEYKKYQGKEQEIVDEIKKNTMIVKVIKIKKNAD